MFDVDGNGSIDKLELTAGLRALGGNPTDAEVNALIMEADSKVKPNGRIEFNEFCELIAAHRKPRDAERAALVQAFRMFDRNGDGVIDKQELRQALTSLGYSKLTNAEVDELFAEADTDHSGTIDFNELVRVMMGGHD